MMRCGDAFEDCDTKLILSIFILAHLVYHKVSPLLCMVTVVAILL